jgi:hypothetical protein
MKTITIDLGDGDCAELFEQLKHGTARRIQEIYQPYQSRSEYQEALKIPDIKERTRCLQGIISQVDLTLANDTMILGQIKEWTLGDITQAVLDDMPEDKHQILSKEANRLYAPPLADSKPKS